MSSQRKVSVWKGHPLLDEKDSRALDLAAAVNEFHHGQDRETAERAALDDYRREKHQRAAGHHLQGMRAAQASGNSDDAKKHFDFYNLHLKALGHEPHGPVPPEIKRYAEGEQAERVFRFKAHGADQFLVNTTQK